MSLTASIVAAHAHVTDGKGYGVGPGNIDCVVAVEQILARVYGLRVLEERAALRVWDPARPWSVIEAVERLGIGVEVDDAPTPGRWHVCQGWRSLTDDAAGPGDLGHAWLWWEPARSGAGRILEANIRRPWDRVLTWGEQRARYRAGVRLAVLSEPYTEPLSRGDVEAG